MRGWLFWTALRTSGQLQRGPQPLSERRHLRQHAQRLPLPVHGQLQRPLLQHTWPLRQSTLSQRRDVFRGRRQVRLFLPLPLHGQQVREPEPLQWIPLQQRGVLALRQRRRELCGVGPKLHLSVSTWLHGPQLPHKRRVQRQPLQQWGVHGLQPGGPELCGDRTRVHLPVPTWLHGGRLSDPGRVQRSALSERRQVRGLGPDHVQVRVPGAVQRGHLCGLLPLPVHRVHLSERRAVPAAALRVALPLSVLLP